MAEQYEVMNPWADVDPTPFKGLAPRLSDFRDKTIGMFSLSYKGGSRPALAVVEEQLKKKYPSLKFSLFETFVGHVIADATDRGSERGALTPEIRANFQKWLKEVDAVVAAIGD